MAGVWREAGRREEEISWEAEGSSMIAQYDLSMLYARFIYDIYAVWSGSVHLSSVDEQVPSRQRRNAWSMSWSQRRLDWRISWCSWLRWTEVQEDSDSCISCPANKSSKNIHLIFFWDCYAFGSLLIGWVLYESLRQKELGTDAIGCFASEWLGSCTAVLRLVSLRVWASFLLSNWGNLRTRFWSWRQPFLVLVLVLWVGEMPHAVDAVSSWCPLYIDYHWFISTTWQGVVN